MQLLDAIQMSMRNMGLSKQQTHRLHTGTRQEGKAMESTCKTNLIYLLEAQKMAIITGKVSVNNIVSVGIAVCSLPRKLACRLLLLLLLRLF